MNPSTTPHDDGRAGGVLSLAYGLVSYLLFGASFCVYWIAFLADRWVPITVNRRPGDALPLWAAVTVDLGLVLLFGLQHSVMARPGFKRWWTKIVPAGLERSTYVLLASLFLTLLMVAWQPLPQVVWQIDSAAGQALLWGLFALGLPVCVLASFQIDHFDLLGLRQAWAHFRGRPYTPPPFVQPWLYRVVRHPIQLGVLLMLWPLPTMSAGHLLLATSMTGYMLIGLWFEERDLVAAFGERYQDYRRRVPGVVPGLRLLARIALGRDERSARETATRRLHLALVLGLLSPAITLAAPPVAVSPGSEEGVVTVRTACPTFSWTFSTEAEEIELAVYRLDGDGADLRPEEAPPVLERSLPAGSVSWTPGEAQCLERSAQYAWFVRSVADDLAGPWSEGSLFRIGSPTTRVALGRSRSSKRERGGDGSPEPVESTTRGASDLRGSPAAPDGSSGRASTPRTTLPEEPPSFRASGDVTTDGLYRFQHPKQTTFVVPPEAFRVKSNYEEDEWVATTGFGFVRKVPDDQGEVGLIASLTLPPASEVISIHCTVTDGVELDPDDSSDRDDLELEMSLFRSTGGLGHANLMASVAVTTEGLPGTITVSETDVSHPFVYPDEYIYSLEGQFIAEDQGRNLHFRGCELDLNIYRLGPS